MSRRRVQGVVTGTAIIEGHIVDAIGGGVCKKHGKYYGHGKHGLADCPFCDIDRFYEEART